MFLRVLIATTTWLLLIGLAPEARAFCRTTTCARGNAPAWCGNVDEQRMVGCLLHGEPIFWDQPCLSFAVQQDGTQNIPIDFPRLVAAVERGFQAWPNASCGNGHPSIQITNLGSIECNLKEFNSTGPNANGVFFRDFDWPHEEGVLGLTTVTFHPITGRIFGVDMEINTTAESMQLGELSLERIVLHEAGHFFGLDHDPDPNTVMFWKDRPLPPHERPKLTPRDVAAICSIYPPDREVRKACEPEPEHGYATDCGGNVYGSCALSARQSPASAVFGVAGLFGVCFFLRRRCSNAR